MPRKKGRRRQDDSDDDFVDPIAEAQKAAAEAEDAAPKRGKGKKAKGKKGRRAAVQEEEDDDEDPLVANLKALGGGSSDDDEDDDEPAPVIAAPAKKGKKAKGKKGRRAAVQEEEDDDEDPLVANLKALGGGSSDDDEDDDEPAPVIAAPAKKGKKAKGKKGRRAAVQEEDDDDEDPLVANLRALGGGSDDDDEEEEEEAFEAPAASKKAKKAKKKGRKSFEEDAEDEDPLVANLRSLELGSDEEGEQEAEPEGIAKKKKKKKSKLEKRLEAAASRSLPEEEEEEEEEEEPLDAADADPEGPEAPEASSGKKEKKKEKKKDKKEKKKKKKKSDGDEDPTEAKEPSGRVFMDADAPAAGSAPAAGAPASSSDSDDAKAKKKKKKKKLSNKERRRLERLNERENQEARIALENELAQEANERGDQFTCSQSAVREDDVAWQNSLDVNIPSFSITVQGKTLFEDSPLQIVHGTRYGLVGPNGMGKSTLLKMIASRQLKLPPRVDFLYVEQEVRADDTPAVQAVLRADKRRFALEAEAKALQERQEAGEEEDALQDRLEEIYEELGALGVEAAESKARRILFGLGFDAEMQEQATKHFSGGWRMRISLARALFIEPTLLMLDEPTNHLDLNAVIWLTDYLEDWKKTLITVSHDQDFLNDVCDEILHLDMRRLTTYRGDYDQFGEMLAQTRRVQQKEWEKQQRRLRALKQGGNSKKKAEEEVKKGSRFREAGASKKRKAAAAAQGGASSADVQEKLLERPRDYKVYLEFPEVMRLSPPIIEVLDAGFRYPGERCPLLFTKMNFGITQDDRVCIVGPNGAGKSTLLKLLIGDLRPTEGEIRRNSRLRLGVFNQHANEALPMDQSPVEHLRAVSPEDNYQSIRNKLGRFNLAGHAHELKCRELSGGQKARVVLCKLALMRPHILLLDEPTNNLDVESIDALIEGLNMFNGGVICISHDKRLITRMEARLWTVEGQNCYEFDGNLEDYKEKLRRELEEQMEAFERERELKKEARIAARAAQA